MVKTFCGRICADTPNPRTALKFVKFYNRFGFIKYGLVRVNNFVTM